MSITPDPGIPELLSGQLKRLRDRLIGIYVAGGIGLTLFVTCLSIAVVMLLDLFFDLPVMLRALMLFSVPAIAGIVLVRSIVVPLLRKYEDVDLAAIVEETHPELRERLLSLVELEQSRSNGETVGSELMRSMLVRQTLQFARSRNFADVVVARRSQRRCWMGAMGVFALLLPLIFASSSYAVLISRFLNPWGNYERLQNLILTVDNADRTVGRGDDVAIVARPSWRFHEGKRPPAIWMDWSVAGGEVQSRRVDWNDADGVYAITLPRVEESFDYSVSSDQSRSRRHHIEVVDRPEIKQFAAAIQPPAYTGLPPVQLEMVLGDVVAVEQSEIRFHLEFNKKVSAAEIVWLESPPPAASGKAVPHEMQNGSRLSLAEDGMSASMQMIASLNGPSGRFLIRVEDENGLKAREETLCRLTITPDHPPLIEFMDLEQHASARPADLLKIPLQAIDDFGVASLELHYELVRNGIRESGMISVDPEKFNAKQVAADIDLDLSRLDLKPGMQVILRGRATDERPVPGPNESWTGIRVLQILEDARPYGEQTLADQQHRVDQAMDHLKQDLEKQRQEARRLQEQAQRNEARHEEWRSDAQAAMLEENVRELGQQFEKLSAVLETQPVMQPLAEQARLLAEKELAQAAARVDQARKADLAEKQQKFSDAAERLQKAREQMHKLQEQHHQLAQMQRDMLELNRLALNTEQLAVQVDELVQRRTGPDGKPLPEGHPLVEFWNQDHQRLVQRHEQLDQDLSRIIEDHPELLEKARANLQHQLSVLGETADQLAQHQRALAKAVEKNASRNAKPNDSESPKPQNAEPLPPEERLASDVLMNAQQALVSQTRELGEMTRKLGLPAPEINKFSHELPNATRAIAHELGELNFKRAAQLSREAAEKATQFLEALAQRQDGTVPERLRSQAEEIRQQQSALADELESLAASSERQSAFREQRQQQLQKQISDLAEELGAKAEQLELKQIDRSKQGEIARQGQEQAMQAQQAVSAAMDREQAEEFGPATEMYQQSVEALKQAASLSREASAGGNPRQAPKDLAQGEAGRQIAESARNLMIAGKQLSELGTPSQSSFNESSSQDSGKSSPQENQEGASRRSDAEGQPNGSSSGEGQGNQMAQDQSMDQGSSSSASQSLRDAARNMRQAAEQLGIGSQAQRTNGPTPPGGRPLDEFSGTAPSDSAGTTSPHLDPLNHGLGNVSRRDWGKLPGHLQTEMIESSRRQRDAAYESRIRRYFEEIYRSRPVELERLNPVRSVP